MKFEEFVTFCHTVIELFKLRLLLELKSVSFSQKQKNSRIKRNEKVEAKPHCSKTLKQELISFKQALYF